MDKEFKKEWIIKIINKIEDKEYLDFLFGFTKGYVDIQRKKRGNNNLDEITIKLLEIQNKLK